MKIAIIADALDYQYAGIYYYTKELLNALAKVDTQNEYWIVRSKSEGDISSNVRELIIPTKKFPGAAPYRLFVTIPRILAKKGIDIVVEPRHFGPFNLPKKIKRITVIHDLSPLHHPEWHQFASRKLQHFFLPSILKRADYVITNSVFTAQDVIQHFPITKNKIKGILLGKESFFTPQVNPTVLTKYKISKPYLLHTGTIEPRKNLGLLLASFENIKRAGQDLQLVLVGKFGWKSEDFMKKVNASSFKEDIKLLGYVERLELPVLYSAATIFVYPSHFEGFGLPVLEAMSCGTPVVTSDVSSLPEIIGKAGILFTPNDLDNLTHQLLKILQTPSLQTSLSKLSLEQAATFSWEKTALETLAVFEQIA